MSKTIRIKDIAKLAGVSVGTVDRVIHNRGQVSKDAYDKVIEVLEKTGYTPNLIARTLGSNKKYRIAALVPDPIQDEYWNLSQDGIEEAIEEWSQYGVKIEVHHFDLYRPSSFAQASTQIIESQPDGILTAPVFYAESLEFFKLCHEKNIPYVVFNNNVPDAKPLSFIGQNLYQSGRVAAELLQMNRKESATFAILHIYDNVQNSIHLSEKEKGFCDYFKELNHQKNSVISLDLNTTHEPTLEKELKEIFLKKDLKGILVTTSRGAAIVSSLLLKHGKDDIRLVAYDLLKENRHYLKRGAIDFLINQNSKRQAFLGIGQLANHLLFDKKIQPTYLFPLEIISRQNLDSYLNTSTA
ncbi:MAG TPA: LacI family DNA-binding transcriptional regulator [Cyclobacteriaceae bacterium]|nr:LacI family DNA-binding transcriptional regulator [Cyclobacteriaceae bacterium]